MQEVFEKIVEDLKSLEAPCELGMIENGRYILRDKAIEIVKQAAAEYNKGSVISMEHDGCKGCKYEHCSADSKGCQGCKQNAVDKYTKMTQFDRIKSMSIEELAALITSGEMCAICPFCKYYGTNDCYIENDGMHKNCDEGIMKWLQSEVEVGE